MKAEQYKELSIKEFTKAASIYDSDHAFPDKNKAFDEVFRVLKPGGKIISCFYICGESCISDALVQYVLAPKGWFTPPFETRDSVKAKLEKRYRIDFFESQGSIISFTALKPI